MTDLSNFPGRVLACTASGESLMSQDDYLRIRVADFEVGLIGLKSAIEEVALTHGEKSDGEVQQELLNRLREKNYIPASSREVYGEALIREFRKFLGRPHETPSHGPLRITALGPGCSQCDRMVQTVMGVLNSMGLPASVEHVTDIEEIARYGFLQMPALIINNKVVCMGTIPSETKLKSWIAEAASCQDESK